MEAYCSGINPAHPDLVHTATVEDRKKLARQHKIQQNLPSKHESAINVLRGRQEKETELKLEKQAAELETLDATYEEEKDAEEAKYLSDRSRLADLVAARRKNALCRWDLKFEIWRHKFEAQHGTKLIGRLPHAEWPTLPDEEAEIPPESALAVYFSVE